MIILGYVVLFLEKGDAMNAIYARVSTEDQARHGYSLQSQIDAGHKFFNGPAKEYTDDGYSGEYLERPHLEQLRQDLKAGLIKQVVIYDPDRLARKLSHMLLLAEEIEKAGAELHFITGNFDASPEGKLFFSMRGAIAEFEKEKIRERTMRGKRSKALKGKLVFNDEAYGYDYDSDKCMYVVNEKEAEAVRTIFDLYVSNMYGVTALRADLTAREIFNKKGTPFAISNLTRILKNEMYCGTKWAFARYDKTIGIDARKHIRRDPSEWIPIQVPPIIPRELWEKTQKVKAQNYTLSKRNAKRDYLLSGLVKCPICGYAMTGTNTRSFDKYYYYYYCSGKSYGKDCPNRASINAEKLEEMVWKQFVQAAKSGKELPIINKDDTSDQKDRLEKHLAELKNRQSALLRWVSSGTITIDTAEGDLQNLARDITATQSILSGLAEKKKTPSMRMEDILNATTYSDKRRVLLDSQFKILAQMIEGKIRVGFSL